MSVDPLRKLELNALGFNVRPHTGLVHRMVSHCWLDPLGCRFCHR